MREEEKEILQQFKKRFWWGEKGKERINPEDTNRFSGKECEMLFNWFSEALQAQRAELLEKLPKPEEVIKPENMFDVVGIHKAIERSGYIKCLSEVKKIVDNS